MSVETKGEVSSVMGLYICLQSKLICVDSLNHCYDKHEVPGLHHLSALRFDNRFLAHVDTIRHPNPVCKKFALKAVNVHMYLISSLW